MYLKVASLYKQFLEIKHFSLIAVKLDLDQVKVTKSLREWEENNLFLVVN